MNISSVNLILKSFLVVTMCILSALEAFELTNHEKTYPSRRVRKNHYENLCPDEYKSCWCDYINLSLSSSSINNPRANSVSISINCQQNQNDQNEETKKLNKTSSYLNKFKKQSLNRIPRISTNSSMARFKYLKQIVHIDLSHTDISEIETEAFQGLTGLNTIVITNCKKLTRVKMFAFRNLPNLKTLIISNNPNLNELEPHALGGLKNLNQLSLNMNQLKFIDSQIFSSSTSIKTIDFIGNPIKRIKSFAFSGLKNVTDLLLSLNQNVTPIEAIEGDSFISTGFIDNIFLEGIPARTLPTNAFRGLSYCKNLHLSSTLIEEIEPNAFFRANYINRVNLQNSRIRNLTRDSFRGLFRVDHIDLRGNYLYKLDQNVFEPLVINNSKENIIINATSSITLIEKNERFVVGRISFEQNPIQCDCNLDWIIRNKNLNQFISLPELCAGPKGYDCLRMSELNLGNLGCANTSLKRAALPCDELEFKSDKNKQIIPDNNNANSNNNNENDVEEDLLDEYADDYSTDKYETTYTQVITPVHVFDSVSMSSTKKMLLGDTTTSKHASSRRTTIDSRNLIRTTTSATHNQFTTLKQHKNKPNERFDRFESKNISSLTSGVCLTNEYFINNNSIKFMTLFLFLLCRYLF